MTVRAVHTGHRLVDVLAQKISAAFDPRARLLRRRRRALRWGLTFGAGCVFWVLTTALLASWPTPLWVLLVTGLTASGAAMSATLLLMRYRWLRSVPLPAGRPGTTRRLPPPGSAARSSMCALGASERGMFSLLGVLERGYLLPAVEIAGLTAAANQAAAAMTATAAEVVSMERTVRFTAEAGPYLVPTIDAFAAQLAAGVRQYNEMVTAAAQLVASANSPMQRQHYRAGLVEATDRLLGWAQAFDELGRLQRA